MSAIYEALEKATLTSDGAMGTMLQDRGLTDGGAPELWNVEKPEEIEAVLEAYAAAGARFITTNTFGGTHGRLAMHGLEDRLFELNKAGAEIARKVADRHPGWGCFCTCVCTFSCLKRGSSCCNISYGCATKSGTLYEAHFFQDGRRY